MVDATVAITSETSENEVLSRIYEVGYHIIPTIAEENLEKVVGGIRATIEKAGGSFIAGGAPTLTKLAYPMEARDGDRCFKKCSRLTPAFCVPWSSAPSARRHADGAKYD